MSGIPQVNQVWLRTKVGLDLTDEEKKNLFVIVKAVNSESVTYGVYAEALWPEKGKKPRGSSSRIGSFVDNYRLLSAGELTEVNKRVKALEKSTVSQPDPSQQVPVSQQTTDNVDVGKQHQVSAAELADALLISRKQLQETLDKTLEPWNGRLNKLLTSVETLVQSLK